MCLFPVPFSTTAITYAEFMFRKDSLRKWSSYLNVAYIKLHAYVSGKKIRTTNDKKTFNCRQSTFDSWKTLPRHLLQRGCRYVSKQQQYYVGIHVRDWRLWCIICLYVYIQWVLINWVDKQSICGEKGFDLDFININKHQLL